MYFSVSQFLCQPQVHRGSGEVASRLLRLTAGLIGIRVVRVEANCPSEILNRGSMVAKQEPGIASGVISQGEVGRDANRFAEFRDCSPIVSRLGQLTPSQIVLPRGSLRFRRLGWRHRPCFLTVGRRGGLREWRDYLWKRRLNVFAFAEVVEVEISLVGRSGMPPGCGHSHDDVVHRHIRRTGYLALNGSRPDYV